MLGRWRVRELMGMFLLSDGHRYTNGLLGYGVFRIVYLGFVLEKAAITKYTLPWCLVLDCFEGW